MQYFAFQEIALLLFSSNPIFTHGGKRYRLRSIERENGSGRSFNVHVWDMDNNPVSLYIRITG